MIATAIFLLMLGLAGLAMSANAIYEYGKVVEMSALNYAYGHEAIAPTYTNGRKQAYKDQVLMNLADSIWKIRDIATENEIVQVADERGELYELLAQAAVLVDTIRARS